MDKHVARMKRRYVQDMFNPEVLKDQIFETSHRICEDNIKMRFKYVAYDILRCIKPELDIHSYTLCKNISFLILTEELWENDRGVALNTHHI
jgi:hypothetical protein